MPRPHKRLLRQLRKWILIPVGGCASIAGLLTFWLPLPIGLPLLLIGTFLLTRNSPRARLWLRPIRQRFRVLRSQSR